MPRAGRRSAQSCLSRAAFLGRPPFAPFARAAAALRRLVVRPDCRARRVTPRFFVRRAARADIAEAFRWYERRSAGLGHEFLRSVRVAFAEIGTRARTISDCRG